MNAETWPAADERLMRRYRLLLLAYSGRYRRRHGTEMITTMLEMAGPARSRPSAGEAWHLIGSGVRQRFRLPSGRPLTVIAAVLVSFALAVFGAAAGSWLGASTSADLPSRNKARQLLHPVVTDPATSFVNRFSGPGRADLVSVNVFPGPQRPNWTVDQARTGLTAAGWTITEFTVHPAPASVDCTADACTFESTTATVNARRHGLVLRGTATDYLADNSGGFVGGIGGELFVERSAAYLPLTITGGLLGALAGWLLAAALAYRMKSMPPARSRLAATFTGVALTLAAPPAWAIIVNAVMLAEHLTYNGPVYNLHAALLPASHLDGVGAWLIPACTVAAAAAAAITLTILLRATGREHLSSATQPT